ncbi:MAG: Ig-like domain-containing protein [Eubacterium sp.]|nr:Ig-like domain-containing protein [Eubacterium sp.]
MSIGKMRWTGIFSLFFVLFAGLLFGMPESSAKDKMRDVRVHNQENVIPADYNREFFHVGDHGFITFAKELRDVECPGAPEVARESIVQSATGDDFQDTTICYSIDDESVLTINEEKHTYRILAGGEATVIMSARISVPDETAPGGTRQETWLAKYTFIVMGDASGVLPECEIATSYMVYNTTGSADVALMNCPNLRYYSFDYTSTNGDMCVSVSFDPWTQMLHIESGDAGITELKLYLNGTLIRLTFDNRLTTISSDRLILDEGDSSQLTIDQYSGSLKWHSMDKSVATVSKTGAVTAVGIGNTIVYAHIGQSKIGCVVSVVPTGHSKVVEIAAHIGATRSYSQPMRMLPGYYDCSSLVWMAYSSIGRYFGVTKFAPTAASEAQWCEKHNRILGEWTWEKFNNMEYLPGDLLFRVGASNGRYLGIYHVEMFAGYRLMGFDENGEPELAMCWANRPDNNYEPCGDIMGRP